MSFVINFSLQRIAWNILAKPNKVFLNIMQSFKLDQGAYPYFMINKDLTYYYKNVEIFFIASFPFNPFSFRPKEMERQFL